MKCKNVIILVFFAVVFPNLYGQDDSCNIKFENEFHIFLFNLYDGSFDFTLSSKCNIEESLKKDFSYVRNYCGESVEGCYELTYRGISTISDSRMKIPEHNSNSSYRPWTEIDQQFLPVLMVRYYFISSIYYQNFEFRPYVKLGENDSICIRPLPFVLDSFPTKDKQYYENERILKEAKKSIDKWLVLLDKYGLEYLRKNKIEPLSFTTVKWL